jgi:multidrug efflux system membrane fusion protein
MTMNATAATDGPKHDRRWRIAIGLVVAVLVMYVVYRALQPTPKPKAPPAIPVDIATVSQNDVPVYVEGLGTVQAFYTVTITARVDGQLDAVEFTEGQEVRKGAELAQIDPRPFQAALEQAVANSAKDSASLANARRDLARYEELAPEELASKQTVDTQRAQVAQLQAQVAGDEANVDSARTQLAYTRITSPISGRTGLRMVDPGNIVRASDAGGIVVVTQMQPIATIFTVPEDQLGQINEALARGPVEAVALSRDRTEEFDRGTVSLVDNQIDPTTGTVRVKATFPNAKRRLWPGQFINVRVQTDVRHQALTIPQSALQRGPDGVFTYVVQADSTVRATQLTLGEQVDGTIVVTSGLKAGEQVAASNQYRLQPKSLVRASTPVAQASGRDAAKGSEKVPAKAAAP